MSLLLLGFSRIAQRRILPALARLGESRVDIATCTRAGEAAWPVGLGGLLFADYDSALARSAADWVYVSTENSTHAQWVERALQSGRHVVVDKPAFLSLADTRRLLDLAASRGLCLAEATVYLWHPQFDAVRRIFADACSAPTRIAALFSCPPLAEGNFRYRRDAGGGTLWDQGPYAVTPGRILFGEDPEDVICRVTSDNGEVDTSFSVLMTYPGGRSMVGHYGFNTGYRNSLEVLGPRVTVGLDRVFSLPANADAEIRAAVEDRTLAQACPAADSFALFLKAVREAIAAGDHRPFADALWRDAAVLDRMRQSAAQARGQ